MQPANALRNLLLAITLVGGLNWMPAAIVHAEENSTVGYRVPDYTAGVQAYRSGDYEKAVNYFRRTLAQDSENTNAHYYLGLSLDNLNMAANAAAEYQYVLLHGHETKIVDYARTRLHLLRPHLASASSAQGIAMVAAGTPSAASVYRGSASQFAVPLRNNRNALMVDATLSGNQNSTTGVFIIDTGATYTSISQEMAEQLGLDLVNCEKVHITTANGRIEVPKVVIETLNVNGLEAHNVEATVIQVRHGSSFSGLLGLSFIRQFVLTIDPQGGQLIFQRN